MAEKRFKQVVDGVKDTRTGRTLTHPLEFTLKLNEINELYDCVFDRNEELEKENKQLKQDLEEHCNFSLHDVLDKKNKEIEQLRKENKELQQDNDIKFWKHQFMTQHNRTQLILHELSLAMNEGYEFSDKFKEWLDDLTEKNKEVITKHKRLFE